MQPTAVPPNSELTGGDTGIAPGLTLPLPDDAAAAAARDRLTSVDIGVNAPTLAALGMLAEAVVFVASVQGNPYPRPLLSTRVVLLTGSHAGGLVAGLAPDPRNAVPLQHLAVAAGAGVVTLEWQPAAAAIEFEDAITPEQMDAALRAGWAEADRAADEGIELLVLAAGGPGAAPAAAAVIAGLTGAESTALLGRVVTPSGLYDDNAWMTRCLALRDALHRVRDRDGDPRTVLSALGGADIAAATGLLLGAASRRTPVMIDGPVGAAAALVANEYSSQCKRWLILPDAGRHPAVRFAAGALELRPWFDLCYDLGEGATSLACLPMLQTALTLAGVGEQVSPSPLTRYDSSGNQVFVGVARPVESDTGDLAVVPTDGDLTSGVTASTVETAPVQTDQPAGKTGSAAPAKATDPGKPATSTPDATTPKAEKPATGTPDAGTAPKPGTKTAPAKGTPAKAPAKAGKSPKSVPAATKDTGPSVPSREEPARGGGPKPSPEGPMDSRPKDPATSDDGMRGSGSKDAGSKDAGSRDAGSRDAGVKANKGNESPAKEDATTNALRGKPEPRKPGADSVAAKPSPVKGPADQATRDAGTKDAGVKDAAGKDAGAKDRGQADPDRMPAQPTSGAGGGDTASNRDSSVRPVKPAPGKPSRDAPRAPESAPVGAGSSARPQPGPRPRKKT